MKKQHLRALGIIFLSIAIVVTYFIVDYQGVLSGLGFNPAAINLDLLGIVVNSVTVLVLYCLSFIYIDKRQIEKDQNMKDLCSILLYQTYTSCKKNHELICNHEIVKEYIIPKLSEDKSIIHNLQEAPFKHESELMNIAEQGNISIEEMQTYLFIRDSYKFFVNMRIVFYDSKEQSKEKQEEVNALFKDESKFLSMLNDEIKRIEKDSHPHF